MISQQVTIVNKLGLHARAASKLVNQASRYESEVFIGKDGNRVNAKSIMGVMMLAASKGTEILLEADGSDDGEEKQHNDPFCAAFHLYRLVRGLWLFVRDCEVHDCGGNHKVDH